MIELRDDGLRFSFPKVHRDANLSIEFQRTLRIPDDDGVHRLPPGLGRFPLRHVDDYSEHVPASWIEHGGVMLPMFQSEALWVRFIGNYPCAVKVAAGKINAVSGERWRSELGDERQDHVVAPKQRWLDGYSAGKGVIRQFVAMPLGAGYSAEEQITGTSEHGGIQVVVYPMKAKCHARLMREKRKREEIERRRREEEWQSRPGGGGGYSGHMACASSGRSSGPSATTRAMLDAMRDVRSREMGLALGGRMSQEIYEDEFPLDHWDTKRASRCFVHITNSLVWSSITGAEPPHPPPTAKAYTDAGLPWFEYYDDGNALEGAEELADLESVAERGERLGEKPLPENETVIPKRIVKLRRKLKKNQVREWGDTR